MANHPRALGIATTAGIVTLVLWPSSATAHLPFGSFYPILLALGFLAVGLMVARVRLRRPPYVVPIIAFYVIVTLVTAFVSIINPFSLLLPLVVISAYWATYSATESEKRGIVRAIVVLAAFEVALAFGEVFLDTGVLLGAPFLLTPENPFLEGSPRGQGTLGHPIVLSFLLVVALGLVCAKRSKPLLRMLLLASFVIGTVLTGSSSGVVISLVIVMFWFLNRSTPVGATFAVLTSVAGVLILVTTGFTATILEQEFDEQNAGHRINSIRAIPNLIFQRDAASSIFGSGYSNNEYLYTSNILINDGFFTVDNQFVTFLAQGGLVGLALIMAALVGITLRIGSQAGRRFLPGWVGLLAMGVSFDFMAWYAAGALFLVYAAIAQGEVADNVTKPRRGLVTSGHFEER